MNRSYNAAVRWELAQVAISVAAGLLAGHESIHAQTMPIALPGIQSEAPCPLADSSDRQQTGPEISIVGVSFSGALQMGVVDQAKIADSVKHESYRTSLEVATNEALEKARVGWLNRGYSKVQVTGEARTLSSSPDSQRIALFVQVDEGAQYRLSRINFKNNKAISNVEALRSLFPIKDGDIFSRERIAKGLENLRKAYLNLGYINFTSVPDTVFDDENRLTSLNIDVDEGKQFYVRSLHVLGLDEPARQEILRDFPVGRIYNARLFDLFLEKHSALFQFSSDDPRHIDKQLDERAGTVAITLDARRCP